MASVVMEVQSRQSASSAARNWPFERNAAEPWSAPLPRRRLAIDDLDGLHLCGVLYLLRLFLAAARPCGSPSIHIVSLSISEIFHDPIWRITR